MVVCTDTTRNSTPASYQKYIYPKNYFKLPKDAVITDLKVHFSNADGPQTYPDEEFDLPQSERQARLQRNSDSIGSS